jgi:CheY-like chemotaxis protein
LPETAPKLPVILVVDDDQNDVVLVKRAFERAGLKHPIQTVSSGVDCIGYLTGEWPYRERDKFPLPSLVFLDIKMPGTDGFEVLKWIRHQERFAKLCVVMLTASDAISDATLAYQLGADSFLVKPLDFWDAAELSHSLERLLARC